MSTGPRPGDCVRLPDGRIARVRDREIERADRGDRGHRGDRADRGEAGDRCRVRVRRATSETHQFLWLPTAELEVVDCPSGWMSPAGYLRYLEATLAKMRQRRRERS